MPWEPGQPGRALIREEVLPGREILSLYCSMGPAKPLCRQGKLRHAKGGQRGEGEHVFYRESLFLPSQEECQARGTAGSNLPNAAHALPLKSPASPGATAVVVGKILSEGFTVPLILFRWPTRGPRRLPCQPTPSSHHPLPDV